MITLRHFSREDAESIHENLYPDMTETEITDMIDEWNACVYEGRYFETFAVLSDHRIVGYASLYERSPRIASAGIEIYQACRGKGFASGAMAVLIRHASKKGYRIILDQVKTGNQASIRLHEKLGFESDQCVYRNKRDHEVLLYLKSIE